jgi:hypothetical protein
MKTVIHPCGEGNASALYRLVWPAEILQSQGHDIEIRYDFSYMGIRQPGLVDRVVGIQGDVDGDVIVFQRPLRREWYELMGHLQDRGIAVVVELDDAFHCIPMHNPARKEADPFGNPDKNYLWLERACERADWVTCTTDALARHYAPHGRVSVIPNYMPKWYTEIPRPEQGDVPMIGWTGTVQNHGRDLHVTKGSIGRALELSGAQLGIVGTGKGVADALNSVKPSTTTGWISISEYPVRMAEFDVGMVPLQLNRFNMSKSWLKVCEFASLGIPVVASPTEDNIKAAALGLCTLAESPEQWLAESLVLLGDRELREERGRAARSLVTNQLTIEDNAYQWGQAWSAAYANAAHHSIPLSAGELTNA